jgi:hypothetical protein
LEFDGVYPALTGFALGDEGLRSLQTLRDLDLAESRLPAGLSQPSEKLAIALTIGGILQSG